MRRADREVTDVDGIIDIIDHCKVCHNCVDGRRVAVYCGYEILRTAMKMIS